MTEFGSLNHSPGKRVLNNLKMICLRFWKVVVYRFEVEIGADTTKFTNVIITSLIRERERGNVFGVGNYCYVAVCLAALGALAPIEGGEGRGISWWPPAYSLLLICPPNEVYFWFLHSVNIFYLMTSYNCRVRCYSYYFYASAP